MQPKPVIAKTTMPRYSLDPAIIFESWVNELQPLISFVPPLVLQGTSTVWLFWISTFRLVLFREIDVSCGAFRHGKSWRLAVTRLCSREISTAWKSEGCQIDRTSVSGRCSGAVSNVRNELVVFPGRTPAVSMLSAWKSRVLLSYL